MCLKPPVKWFECLNELVKVMYEKSGKLVKLFYRSVPILVIKFIQMQHEKLESKSCITQDLTKWS